MGGILPEFRSIHGLVVAGGAATRLGGTEKAFLDLGSGPIVLRTLALFRRLFAGTIVATSRPEPWRGLDVRIVPDEVSGAGPLSGLAGGLAAAPGSWVFAVAGDMPLLDERLVRLLCASALLTGRPVIPRLGGWPEPLHAVWRTQDAGRARAALLSGGRKLTGWLAEDEACFIDVESVRGLPGAERSFRNVNDPRDLAELRAAVDAGRGRGHTRAP